MDLTLASRNAHKLREFGRLLTGHRIVSLPDDVDLPPEDGLTFAENAIAKALAAFAATGRVAIADDSGIEAAALGGGPGIRSARFAGATATDQQNLALLLDSVAPEADRSAAYVCAIALVEASGRATVFEERCEGRLAERARGEGGFGYDPAFLPAEITDGRTMAELTDYEKDAISHRGKAARSLLEHLERTGDERLKTRAAALSIASNSALVVLKLVAGAVTGSIAIVTEAIHSAIDLMASVVAYFSIRKADEPADESHTYGHEKFENVAAGVEAMLILVGAGVIIFESVKRLAGDSELQSLGFGIVAIAVSAVVNVVVSAFLYRRARQTDSPALEGDAAHLRTDALTSIGVLAGLVAVELTGFEQIDALVALAVAAAIVAAGLRLLARASRVLLDEALPVEEMDAIKAVIEASDRPELVGYHKLRARRAGSRRHVDLHLQFRSGTTLERAHDLSHELESRIRGRLPGTDVLIHLEPDRSGGAERRNG